MIQTLRPYQAGEQGILGIRAAFNRGARLVLYVLPTGGGKTVVFSFCARAAAAKGSRVGILVHRDALLQQASRSLSDCGVAHGIIAPGHSETRDLVQVASVHTLVRRIARYRFDFLVMDEAHHATAGTWSKILAGMPLAKVLGVTATPVRMDGRGMDHTFEDLVIGPSIQELIGDGYLVKPIVYAPAKRLDLSGIRTRGGDYDKRALHNKMDQPKITGDAVDHYKRLCPGVPGIVFCVSVKHAEDVADDFQAAGIAATTINGKMKTEEIRRRTAGIQNGRYKILTSCDLISEGFDAPKVGAAILLRPTKSEALYVQQIGRALRPAPGKDRAYILDHAGNVFKHGMPDDERAWTLEGRKRKARGEDVENVLVRQCPVCFCCHTPAPYCIECGHFYAPQERKIQEVEGELEQIERIQLRTNKRREIAAADTYEDFQAIAAKYGYKPGWAALRFQLRQR